MRWDWVYWKARRTGTWTWCCLEIEAKIKKKNTPSKRNSSLLKRDRAPKPKSNFFKHFLFSGAVQIFRAIFFCSILVFKGARFFYGNGCCDVHRHRLPGLMDWNVGPKDFMQKTTGCLVRWLDMFLYVLMTGELGCFVHPVLGNFHVVFIRLPCFSHTPTHLNFHPLNSYLLFPKGKDRLPTPSLKKHDVKIRGCRSLQRWSGKMHSSHIFHIKNVCELVFSITWLTEYPWKDRFPKAEELDQKQHHRSSTIFQKNQRLVGIYHYKTRKTCVYIVFIYIYR